MIKATFTPYSMTIEGHAGASDGSTYDLVCAAVSATTSMWANGLTEMNIPVVQVEEDSGFLFVVHDECERYQRVIIKGLRDIETLHPENLKVVIRK